LERKRRILVAPLDWGLGHATRCIPIINALLKRNAEVIIAASGSSAELLKVEFPNIKHCSLPAYNPSYPANSNMVWAMARQLPHFVKTIYNEHATLNKLIEKEQIEVVISDNRYGCYSHKVKSILIYHQLHILMDEGYKWMEGYVNHFNNRQIKHFDECWIPAPNNELLGNLLPPKLPAHTRFIGYQSRFNKQPAEIKYHIVAIASGPDPQRTLLTNMLRNQLIESGLRTFLVHGLVSEEEKISVTGNFTEANYLTSDKLNNIIQQGNIIIARSGYSTIMDMAKLGKKAIFIPTPGQTEQAYLAAQLMNKGISLCVEQSAFNLKNALKESDKFSGFTNFEYHETLLGQAIQSIL
jgi:uncharacterized protein (TIGR00661 family)